jgi:hypothetical protein
MAHRTGCKDPAGHAATFGACARAAHIAVQWLESTGADYGRVKAFDRETDRYWQAVDDGLDPTAPTNEAVDDAYRMKDVEAALPDVVKETISEIKGD